MYQKWISLSSHLIPLHYFQPLMLTRKVTSVAACLNKQTKKTKKATQKKNNQRQATLPWSPPSSVPLWNSEKAVTLSQRSASNGRGGAGEEGQRDTVSLEWWKWSCPLKKRRKKELLSFVIFWYSKKEMIVKKKKWFLFFKRKIQATEQKKRA